MNTTTIEIKKINEISRSEFKSLIQDPTTHLQFLRQRMQFHSKDNIDNILDELAELVTDVYYVDVVANDMICVVYFWSLKDFAHFRR